jgi:Protein of unknown function (DUF3037)
MFACRYAILRFLPYVETGEFANVGIVLMSATGKYFGFRLLNRRLGRVTQFFEMADAKALRAGLAAIKEDLERIKQMADANTIEGLFAELVRERETLFRFDLPRAILAESPEAALHDLYTQYVERDSVTKVKQEFVMEQGLRQLLSDAALVGQYVPTEVGVWPFQVKFPFVRTDRQGLRIIKPLHLSHVNPAEAVDHALFWAAKVNALKRRNLLQGEILFTLQGGLTDTAQLRVKSEVEGILHEVDVHVVDQTADDKILEFARAA